MKRPVVKWMLRLVGVGLLLLLAAAGYIYWDWKTTRNAGEVRLAKVIAELDEKEPGWRDVFTERNKRLAPPERNSAEKALAVVRALPGEFHEWCNVANPTNTSESNQLIEDGDLRILKERMAPHAAAVAKLRDLIATEPNSGFAIADDAPNLNAASREKRTHYRRVAQLLAYDCLLRIEENNPDEAIRDCRALIGSGRAIGDDPLLLWQIARIACNRFAVESAERTLGTGEPRTGLAALQEEFLRESRAEFHAKAVRGERVMLDRVFAALDEGKLEWESLFEKKSARERNPLPDSGGLSWRRYRRLIPEQRALQLEMSTRHLPLMELPYGERYARIGEIYNERDEQWQRDDRRLIGKLYSDLGQLLWSEHISRARLGVAATGVATERFRIANGRWPKDLEEIPKTLLDAFPTDPITGEPVRLNETETGVVIESDALSFRLYDPKHRRQPAPVIVTPDLPDIEQYKNPKP